MSISARLQRALDFLFDEYVASTQHHRHQNHDGCRHVHAQEHHGISEDDTWTQLSVLKQLLCRRPPEPELPPSILGDIDAILAYERGTKVSYPSSSLNPYGIVRPKSGSNPAISSRLFLHKGDITALSEVTAIVNAGNSQLLGCFVPGHHCIDNAIHAAAGPRLRDYCWQVMDAQGHEEPVGLVKITPGFNLYAKHVLHTVGPQLKRGQAPTQHDIDGLKQCYISCLEAAEAQSALEDGRRVLVLCCISAGLFAFPPEQAAKIAVQTVAEWCREQGSTGLTDIIFDVFTEKDQSYYARYLREATDAGLISHSLSLTSSDKSLAITASQAHIPKLKEARHWLKSAAHLLISAGAGLSAADGLDYTSTDLFSRRFSGFRKFGLRRLYDGIGFRDWPSARERWGYAFTSMLMLRSWPASPMYASLRSFTTNNFPNSQHFVRTTNADGLFAANSFDPGRIATPQGQYAYLQCSKPCRKDAVVPSKPFVDAVIEHELLDPKTQILKSDEGVPHCEFCGREMTICVRGGNYYTDHMFQGQNKKYKQFVEDIETHKLDDSNGIDVSKVKESTCVILELGVGMNTPSVLRWPDEDLVAGGEGKFKLIRVGIGAAGCTPWEFEEDGLAIGIDGDIKEVLTQLLEESQ